MYNGDSYLSYREQITQLLSNCAYVSFYSGFSLLMLYSISSDMRFTSSSDI